MRDSLKYNVVSDDFIKDLIKATEVKDSPNYVIGLFDVKTVSETIAEEIRSLRRISRFDADLNDKIEYLVRLAVKFNAQPWYSKGVDSYRWEDIQMPQFIDWIIVPSKVSITNDMSTEDLLDHNCFKFMASAFNEIYDPDKVRRYTERIYGHLKLSGKYFNMSDKRVKVLLNDVIWTVPNSNKEGWVMHANDNVVSWPIPVKDCVGHVYGDDYLLDNAWGQMGEFIITRKYDNIN